MRSSAEKERLLSNLTMLVRSGMDLASCIAALEDDARETQLKKKLSLLKHSLERGDLFSRSLERAQIFSPTVISLIALGERSGRLTENLLLCAAEEQKGRQFRDKLYSALLYPGIVLSIALFVGGGVTLFILPKLADLFSNLGIDLPLLTQMMVTAGRFLQHAPPAFVPLALAGAFLIIAGLFSDPRVRSFLFGLLCRVPVIGSLLLHIELARMGYVAGTLLQAGVPIVDMLQSLASTAPLERHRIFYSELARSVENGHSLKDALGSKKAKTIIPRPVQYMLATAEQSGRLGETFSDIGRLFEEKSDEASKRLTVALEPMLLVLVWIGVVLLALAVLLPIYNLIGAINR